MRISKIAGWIVFGLVALGWFAFLRPAFMGGQTGYVMVSGSSMEPTFHSGDLVITRQAPGYEAGDVVAFRVPQGHAAAGSMVIHRVTGGDGAAGYETRGDNRDNADLWTPTDADVVGRQMFLVPKVGWLFSLLRSPLGIAVAAGIAVFVVVVTDRSKEQDDPVLEEIPDVG